MNTSQKPLEYTLAVFIIAAAFLQLAVSYYYAWPFTTDDAFISWGYARHLAQGDGLRWSISPPVEGFSNFSWVLFVSMLIKFGLPVAVTVKYFAGLSLLAALVCLYQLSRTFLSILPATLPVYLFSHYNGVVWWTVSGLETSFFVALVLFVSWQSARAMGFSKLKTEPRHDVYNPYAWILSCIGLTLLAVTRFDGAIWSIVVGGFICCSLWYSEKNVRHHYLSILCVFFVFFALPYTTYFIWRIVYFGRFLPNSYVCKAFTTGYTFQLVIDYLHLAFPCLILSLPYFFARKDCRHILLWLPSLIYSLLLYHANPNIAYYNRLFLGAFSVFTILPSLGMHEFFNYFHYTAKKNALVSTGVILIFTHLFIPGSQINSIKTAVEHYQQRSDMRLKVAELLNREVGQGERVLLADCGLIPFFARMDIQFIDSLCLNNKEMTSKNMHHSQSLYAKRIQEVIKPEWVIDTYYPKLRHGNFLNDELHQSGFYNKYTMVTSYQSHRLSNQQGKITIQEADFSYQIYKRK